MQPNYSKQFYFCYDRNLSNYIRKVKNIPYITKAINPNSHRMFWLYWRSPEIDKAITEFFGQEKSGQI